MLAKLIVCVLALAVAAALTLVQRQQRLEIAHELTEAHVRIRELEDQERTLRSVIADRAVEWSEKAKQEKDLTPADINTLLAEADQYKREFEKSKAGTPSQSEAESKSESQDETKEDSDE